MTNRFKGKSALITGAASGIGAATSRLLSAEDISRLVLVDLDIDGLSDLELGSADVVRLDGDVASEDFWNRAAPAIADLDLAVVNAGVANASTITELEFAEWRHTLSVNLDGAFLTLRAALRAMDASGRAGSIVCTASVGGIKPEPGTAAYGSSKAALIQLTKVAAKEAAATGIRVNAIAPGGVETPIWNGLEFFDDLVASEGSREKAFAAMAKMATPLGRFATPEEIAGQIAFLLSDDAATITGAVLTSDGGYSL